MTKYCYVYTGDKNKEERLKRIDKAVKEIEKLKENVVFAVNDLQSISYLNDKGYKALNLDALADVYNLITHDDFLYVCTPEDTAMLKASYPNVKEICDE